MGVALNMILVATTTLLRLVQSWTSFEMSLESVARLKAFEHEARPELSPAIPLAPERGWPARGEIVFNHVAASYE
jgi:ABC-type multidrug transport system fused ATPase/permease subunit